MKETQFLTIFNSIFNQLIFWYSRITVCISLNATFLPNKCFIWSLQINLIWSRKMDRFSFSVTLMDFFNIEFVFLPKNSFFHHFSNVISINEHRVREKTVNPFEIFFPVFLTKISVSSCGKCDYHFWLIFYRNETKLKMK